MEHLKDITKSIENKFRRSTIGDTLIQVYRILKLSPLSGQNSKVYGHMASRDGLYGWRIYPIGYTSEDFAEPEQGRQFWK